MLLSPTRSPFPRARFDLDPDSLHRRNHKERSQLVGRQRLGLLEKHKDYVLRARDYASKKQRIKRLQEKVAERNKDEFYFGMVKTKTKVRSCAV